MKNTQLNFKTLFLLTILAILTYRSSSLFVKAWASHYNLRHEITAYFDNKFIEETCEKKINLAEAK